MPCQDDFQLKHPELLRTGSYVGGQWLTSKSQFNVVNPANNQILVSVADAGVEEADKAVQSAYQSLKTWSRLSANERAQLLRAWFNLMLTHQEDLARILTLEQGKPIAEAKAEIAYGASYIEWFAEESKRIYGDTIAAPSGNNRLVVIKQPIGVVSAITPWNFPNAMIARKAAAALAAGCTFIVRPSELTPLSALAMAALAEQAGIPKGVFNVVVSEKPQAIGEVLTQHPNIAKFTFTGSTAVGKHLSAQCATTIKKVSMELGGNAPFIVFDDADLDAAVAGLLASKFRNNGQTCVSSNRIFVAKRIANAFTEKLEKAVKGLTYGSGLDPENQLGPLINQQAIEKVHGLVTSAINKGAELLTSGYIPNDRNFYPPTILRAATNEMEICQQEIFGPVVAIVEFDEEQEVIELANDTKYGLAAYFYARDIGRIWRVSEQLEFGMIGINEGVISNPAAPFGGWKQSGYGREGSKYGLEDYLEIKYLNMGGIDA